MKKFTIEFKWAIISIIIFLAWMTLEKQLGFHDEKIKLANVFYNAYYFSKFSIVLLSFRKTKKRIITMVK
ncbi:MAG: hypothetical protein LRY32_01965 [Flavobacterium sp.]|nr:hypothetical protein [Flavobacterium sp.]